MKKKFLITLLSGVCVTACAFGLTACNMFGGGNNKHEHDYDTSWANDETYHWHTCLGGGDCDTPEKDKAKHVDANSDGYCDICERGGLPEKQDAPVEIEYSYTDTKITVEDAYYGTDKTTSWDTEYRLDDGEWKKRNQVTRDYIYYTDLTPASTHTLYARMGENGNFAASDAFSVSVTLKKTVRKDFPTKDSIAYEMTGRTAVFTLSDGIELSLDGGKTYSTDKQITHTYSKVGLHDVLIRYSETETHTESGRLRISVRATDFAGGYGTEESPYIIGTLEQFKALKDFNVNGSFFVLTGDIAFDNEIWEYGMLGEITIDGRGHKITNLKQKTPLFRSVKAAKNLTVENAVFVSTLGKTNNDSSTNPAILAFDLHSAENVTVSGMIEVNAAETVAQSSIAVGGICARLVQENAGETYGMTGCRADIKVTLPNVKAKLGEHLKVHLGGLAGYVLPYDKFTHNEFATIMRCSANLNLTQAYASEANVGGIVGGFGSTSQYGAKFGPTAEISNCYTTGKVRLYFLAEGESLGTSHIGGIAPEITGSISTCYSTIDFDIDTELYTNAGATIYLGGICAKAHNETDFVKQSLNRCLFAGSISVTNAATANAGGTFKLNAVCADETGFAADGVDYYYKSGVTDSVEGEQTVSGDGARPVEETEMLTVEWQKQSLKITDEYYWITEEGKLPTLK